MQIATIVKDGKQKGNILILSSREGQEILSVFETYCKQNKKKQYARKMKKELEANLECYPS